MDYETIIERINELENIKKALNKEIQEYQSNKVVEQQTIPNEEFKKIEQNQNNQSTS